MRVFVTGATGFVGSAVVQELLKANHEVTGLARSEESAKKLAQLGVKVLHGDLADLESIKRGASQSDGVIHTGFVHDFSKFKENCELDRRVIETMGVALSGSNRPLVVTSAIGVVGLSQGAKLITEASMPPSSSPNPRAATEEASRALLDQGVNVSVVRLPPSTHGEGDHGFVSMLINIAREKGLSAYVEEGLNTWSAVHRLDAAKVFALALDKGVGGSYYHAVAEEGVPFKKIAELIGLGLNLPVVKKSKEAAAAHFTWFAHFASMHAPASSQETQRKLGWTPTHFDLISDMNASYFK